MTFLRTLSERSVFGPSAAENPERPLTDESLMDLLGGLPSGTGTSLSPEQAMRLGAVYRGVQITAGTVGGLPLKAYRHRDRSDFIHPAIEGSEANPYTQFEIWEQAVAGMMLRGNGYLFKKRDSRGNIRDLIPITPTRVTVDTVATDDSPVGWDKVFTIDGKGPFTRYEILHIPMLSIDGIRGLGPIGYARETANIAGANERAAALLFGQGLLQRGFLTTEADLNDEKAKKIKKRWRAKMGGLDNAHDIAILDNGAKFEALTLSPKDAEFIEARKFSVTEIARLLGMPGWMLNDQEKSTSWGTGMEQQFLTWIKVTLQAGYTSRIEQRVSKEILPRSAYSEFLLDGLLRGDSKARAAFYNAGITGGWLVPNDIRPKENMQPVAWGDEPYRPFNEAADAANPGDDDPKEGNDDSNDD